MVKGGLGIGRTCGEKSLQEFSRVNVLPASGLNQAGQHAVILKAVFGSCPEGSFAKDYQMPDGLFGVIIGGRHARMPQTHLLQLLKNSSAISDRCLP